MPSFVKAKASAGHSRSNIVTPMSERQQMALLMQMTSKNSNNGAELECHGSPSSSRSRDRNERGETMLHVAAIKGDVEHVSRLLAHGADPNVEDFAGWTPLHEACNHGWYEVAFRLVQAGANVNAKGLDNETPLHDAVVNSHKKLTKLLVEHGADVRAKNKKGKTPLDLVTDDAISKLLTSSFNNETSGSSRIPARNRDEKKSSITEKKADPEMESSANKSDDVYEFKTKESSEKSPPEKTPSASETTETETKPATTEASIRPAANSPPSLNEEGKRNFSEMSETTAEEGNSASASTTNDDESKRKKSRKDDAGKEAKSGNQARNAKPSSTSANKAATTTASTKITDSGSNNSRKSPVDSPKSATANSDVETEEGKSDLKVPPLKIVIPQGAANEQEAGTSRNGKASSQRAHAALPYVVPSNSEGEKDSNSDNNSPVDNGANKEEKKEGGGNGNGSEEHKGSSGSHHQRVLRSHRGGGQQTDRSSNNSSPQLQRSHSPSPSASPAAQTNADSPPNAHALTATTSKSSDSQASNGSDTEPSASSSIAASASSAPVELHPRKRKMKQNKESSTPSQETLEAPAVSEVHPHEQPIMNCYQLFLNIRKQIDKRRRGLFPVQPKPPQGFKDYLMNRCTYVLAGTAPTTPNITYPTNLMPQMKDLFAEQEKERYKLRMQHVIEKEKLVLSVEQEILRVHGRAARALANQSLPFSVCTILRDEEVYNLITPEQEEKDRNARSRYNGRLFLSWLQDIDDKWEKIKEHMLLRHHNEAESLYAVQKMDWEWKLKELSLCDAKSVPYIDELYVPMVHVSDDFDLP